jgi:predicted TIM-barrel enzyme
MSAMKLYPVVHVRSNEHALELSQQALDAGADGVFLIDHLSPRDSDVLTDAYNHVRNGIGKEAFVGVNYLGLTPYNALTYLSTVKRHDIIDSLPDALWSDDATQSPDILMHRRNLSLDSMRYFGGVAFKYTSTYTDDPELAAILAARYASYTDVMTTSGPGTSLAAGVEKVQAMKNAIDQKQLALASGVAPENVKDYSQYVDIVLAASSIETKPYSGVFVDSKLHELIDAIHRA